MVNHHIPSDNAFYEPGVKIRLGESNNKTFPYFCGTAGQ